VTSPSALPPASGLEDWIRNGRLVVAIILAACTITGTGLAAYFGATAKTDRVEANVDRVAARVEQVAGSVADLRADTERKRQQDQEALNARLSEQEKARQADHEALVRLQEQMRTVSDQNRGIANDVRVLLDRVNAPRPRVVRDYP
jgi:outer membrane murein-binding lipoprotein Lpp